MNASSAWLVAAVRSGALRPRHSSRGHLVGDAGEGVISVAIAVLIMAFLGVLMWGVFRTMMNDVGDKTTSQISSIGG